MRRKTIRRAHHHMAHTKQQEESAAQGRSGDWYGATRREQVRRRILKIMRRFSSGMKECDPSVENGYAIAGLIEKRPTNETRRAETII